jgi:hypothetical protein
MSLDTGYVLAGRSSYPREGAVFICVAIPRKHTALSLWGSNTVCTGCHLFGTEVGVASTSRLTSSPGADRVKLNLQVPIIIIIIKYSILRLVHNLFQSDCSTQCDLVLPLANSSTLSFPLDHPVAACIFFLGFPSLNYIRNGIVDFVSSYTGTRKGLLL